MSNTAMADITFRRVGEDDLQEILCIREDIYGGLDFLPALYKVLLNRYEGFAAIHKNKMVGFLLLSTVDDGETMVIRGDRVAKEHEVSELLINLQKYAEGQFLRNKIVKRKVVVVESTEKCRKLQEEGYQLIFQRNLALIRLNTAFLRTASPTTAVCTVSQDQFSSLLCSEQNQANFFTDERFVVDWISYRLTSSNIPFIVDEGCQMLMCEDKSQSGLFSFGSSYKCKAGNTRVTIDAFGIIGDGANLHDHVLTHCANLHEPEFCNPALIISFPNSFSTDNLKELFKNLGNLEKEYQVYGLEKDI